MKSPNTNFSASLLILISHGAHKYSVSAYQLQKGFTSQQKSRNFQASIQSRVDYASALWDSASVFLLKPLNFLHRGAIQILLLKHNSPTNEDYKNTTLLSLKARLMCNKARFINKMLSGKAPIYHVEKASINHYYRNCTRKLNVPTPRLDLFISSLMHFGPALWNLLPLALTQTIYCAGFQN